MKHCLSPGGRGRPGRRPGRVRGRKEGGRPFISHYPTLSRQGREDKIAPLHSAKVLLLLLPSRPESKRSGRYCGTQKKGPLTGHSHRDPIGRQGQGNRPIPIPSEAPRASLVRFPATFSFHCPPTLETPLKPAGAAAPKPKSKSGILTYPGSWGPSETPLCCSLQRWGFCCSANVSAFLAVSREEGGLLSVLLCTLRAKTIILQIPLWSFVFP